MVTKARTATGAAALAMLLLVATLAAGGTPDSVRQEVDPDDVLLRVDLLENGDARWTVEYRMRLDDENATTAFQTLQAAVESDPENFTARFGRRMRATADAAAAETGRSMTIEDLSVGAEVRQLPQTYGVLSFSFTWTNFARVDDGTIRAGDAIVGLFLDAESQLVMSWPAGYRLETVEPAADETRERAVVWHGEIDFAAGEPRVVVSQAGAAGPLPAGLSDISDVAAPAIGAAAVLGALLLVWRRRQPGDGSAGDGGGPAKAPGASDDEIRAALDGDRTERLDLLSNEEQVIRFVREQGGRVKQQELVEGLDWTEAKTSQVVGELREAGRLEGFRLGRENVLELPDETD